MLFGAMNFPVKSVLSEIERIGDMGFDYVELSMDPPEGHHAKIRLVKSDIFHVLNERKMGIVCHLPIFVSIADLAQPIREASVQETLSSLRIASELGTEKVVLHPGPAVGMGMHVLNLVNGYFFEALEVILQITGSLGITVCLENMFRRQGLFLKPINFSEVFQAFPTLRMTLDVGHAFIVGADVPLDFIRTYPDRIAHVHISDNDGKNDLHFPIGSDACIDYPQIIPALKEIGYDSTMTLEVFSQDPDHIVESRKTIQALLNA
jgi:sugar phosphate isomerase/epimerase